MSIRTDSSCVINQISDPSVFYQSPSKAPTRERLRQPAQLVEKRCKALCIAKALIEHEILPVDSAWLMRADGKEGVMKAADMSFLIPMADVEIKPGHECFYVKGSAGVVAMYGSDGRLIDDSHVYRVKPLFYETNELAYNTRKTYDENGNVLTSETDYENPTNLMSAADRNAYENGFGDYGLISEDGRIITQPLYKNIQALARGVYMCEDAGGFGILLDNDGNRIKK